MGDKEDPKGSGVPPKDHLRVLKEDYSHPKAPDKKTVIIGKKIPELPPEDSGNGDD